MSTAETLRKAEKDCARRVPVTRDGKERIQVLPPLGHGEAWSGAGLVSSR
jgi:hypothetical protein